MQHLARGFEVFSGLLLVGGHDDNVIGRTQFRAAVAHGRKAGQSPAFAFGNAFQIVIGAGEFFRGVEEQQLRRVGYFKVIGQLSLGIDVDIDLEFARLGNFVGAVQGTARDDVDGVRGAFVGLCVSLNLRLFFLAGLSPGCHEDNEVALARDQHFFPGHRIALERLQAGYVGGRFGGFLDWFFSRLRGFFGGLVVSRPWAGRTPGQQKK